MNIILYYFLQPLLSAYNITLLTANIIFSLWETDSQTQSHINRLIIHILNSQSTSKKKKKNTTITYSHKLQTYSVEKEPQRKIILVLGFKRDNKYLKLGRSEWRGRRRGRWVSGQWLWLMLDYLPLSLSLCLSSVSLFFSFLFYFLFIFI